MSHFLLGKLFEKGGGHGKRRTFQSRCLGHVPTPYGTCPKQRDWSEKFEEAGYEVNHETVRGWLMKEGLWERQKKRGSHRQWRERRGQFGALVQMDGSFHCWFVGDAKRYCLMVMVDDAPGVTLGCRETVFFVILLCPGIWYLLLPAVFV